MQVTDVVVSEVAGRKALDFTILGEPTVQNGWRLKYRGLLAPIMYDPLSKEKRKLRGKVTTVLAEVGEEAPLFEGVPLRVVVSFGLRCVTSKDLDNMCKFLLDALEAACYDDDKYIFDLHVMKARAENPETYVSITKI